MRGFPLLRSLLVLLGLSLSGFGLVRLTQPAAIETESHAKIYSPAPQAADSLHYRLLLSAEPAAVSLNSTLLSGAALQDGLVKMAADNPVISLKVSWKHPPAAGELRFAKLILDPPGKATLTHVFDAPGDIDDILELP